MNERQSDSAIWNRETEDTAPDAAPRSITVMWTVGDSLTVDYQGLAVWEVKAALRQTLDLLEDDDE